MKNELKPFIEDNLNEASLIKAGIVDVLEVQKLLKLYNGSKYLYLYNRIWALALLHDFFNNN